MNSQPAFVKSHPDGTILQLKIIPRSSKNQICEALGDRLKIKIAAPPVDSAANEELIRFISKHFGIPKLSVHLVQGRTSRAKTLLIKALSIEHVTGHLSG